jgi:hypothetical protein
VITDVGSGSSLLADYAAARTRLNRSVDLLGQTLDVRALLSMGLDLSDMTDAVDALKREVRALRSGR